MKNSQLAAAIKQFSRSRKLRGALRVTAGISALIGGFMLGNEFQGIWASAIATGMHMIGLALVGIFILFDIEYVFPKND